MGDRTEHRGERRFSLLGSDRRHRPRATMLLCSATPRAGVKWLWRAASRRGPCCDAAPENIPHKQVDSGFTGRSLGAGGLRLAPLLADFFERICRPMNK